MKEFDLFVTYHVRFDCSKCGYTYFAEPFDTIEGATAYINKGMTGLCDGCEESTK